MTIRDRLILNYSQDPFFSQDMFAFICGEWIGEGINRDVFEYNLDPRYVVKVQKEAGEFSNIMEFEIWGAVRHTEYKKFFAQCLWLSGNGRIMLQRKTRPLTKTLRPPERIPHFFLDVKDSNFGYIGGQFVAHDYEYSMTQFINTGLNDKTKIYKSHLK